MSSCLDCGGSECICSFKRQIAAAQNEIAQLKAALVQENACTDVLGDELRAAEVERDKSQAELRAWREAAKLGRAFADSTDVPLTELSKRKRRDFIAALEALRSGSPPVAQPCKECAGSGLDHPASSKRRNTELGG